jgi:phage shock protein A
LQAGEIEALHTRAKKSEGELKQVREHEAQLQRALDQAKTTIAQRDKELKATRRYDRNRSGLSRLRSRRGRFRYPRWNGRPFQYKRLT